MHEAMLLARECGITPGSGFFLDDANIEKGLADFDELGVRWIRSNIPWTNFQPDDPQVVGEEASYNWKGVDQFCATMNSERWNDRFMLITQISNVPDWAQDPARITPGDGPIPLPFDLQSYANAAAAVANRLRGTSHIFEIQNSPNIGKKGPHHEGEENLICDWPIPDPYGYTQLLKLVHPAIHKVRPRGIVLVGGIGGTHYADGDRLPADEFLQALYANGAQGSFDGVSYHPYSQPYLPCAATDTICVPNLNYVSPAKDPYGMSNGWTRMLNAREIMVANGDEAKQIYITEFGGPASGTGKFLTDAEQSELLVAGATRASQYDWVRNFNWFTYEDIGDDPANDDVGGHFMGIVRKNGSRKPAFDAYKNLIH